LDDCVAIVPVFQRAHLKWHYRSRDERLIKFSNHYFYENGLITFPSVSTSNEGRGVRLVYVADGVWDRGRSRTNRREAREAARLIIQQVERYPDRSIGVAAMNTFQREAIEDALNDELRERPDLMPLLDSSRQEPFFVKSLENVQGDERDTIIISIGYGKDASGSLTLNFGPLNMEGGWRRLNVLVTRAKWQTILVTSLRSQELHGVNPQNRGAVALKNFIEYAERSCELPYPPPRLTEEETNDFEDAVCKC
jgi:superfamily I DNA and/or RNA helicase